jgi:hypothetical protein
MAYDDHDRNVSHIHGIDDKMYCFDSTRTVSGTWTGVPTQIAKRTFSYYLKLVVRSTRSTPLQLVAWWTTMTESTSTCTPCPPGQSSFNTLDCVVCTPGYYSDAYAQSTCSSCASGQYSERYGSTQCTDMASPPASLVRKWSSPRAGPRVWSALEERAQSHRGEMSEE